MMIKTIALITVLSPLLGSIIAGFGAKRIGQRGVQVVTIMLMAVSFFAAIMLFNAIVMHHQHYYGAVYTWAVSGKFHFDIGFMLDQLTAVMLLVVTFVSLLVHIYSIGYMQGDSGNQRFFSYMSLFTFMMLMLVSANNFFQLFFGWEGVGLVSYLLIGFWFHKDSAAAGSLKAFLVNRVGDFGFILGIAAIMDYSGSVDYHQVFSQVTQLAQQHIVIFPGAHWSLLTVICILLFIGAMGKSAQIPLHVWLPESMEGPTPISALIHAATMVTAGVFMVARMSPLFELSVPAMSTVLVVGSTGALFLGLLAFVEYDIKRVIAYSTMSQLGYMMAANGVSAYSAGIFHLMTHACFKALLFLCAGSVIIAMHHVQDMRKMGGLRKYLPFTYLCFLVGACALAAIPPFAGFYSKDVVIEAVKFSHIPGASYAYWCLLIGAFVTGYYIFRAFFMTFHGEERIPEDVKAHLKEYPSMIFSLIVLAVPSILIGAATVKWFVIDSPAMLGASVHVLPQYNVLAQVAQHFHDLLSYTLHALMTLPFWFALAGIFMAWFTTLGFPAFSERLLSRFSWIQKILLGQYGFDAFNNWFFVRGANVLSQFFYKVTDLRLIDGRMVNGSGRAVVRLSAVVRRLQTGYLYHYVIVMLVGLIAFLVWMI